MKRWTLLLTVIVLMLASVSARAQSCQPGVSASFWGCQAPLSGAGAQATDQILGYRPSLGTGGQGPLTGTQVRSAAPSGALSGATAATRSLDAILSDTINVQDWGVIADGATSQCANIKAIINGFPSGSVIRLVFPRNAPPAQTTTYWAAGSDPNCPVVSNGRIVEADFEPGAYLGGTSYFAIDRIEQTLGFQKFTQVGSSNGYFGGASLTTGDGYETNIVNYSAGPNTNVFATTYTDTRVGATGATTLSNSGGGGQLELFGQGVLAAPRLVDSTGLSFSFTQMLGPIISEINYDLGNNISSQLHSENDLYSGMPNVPWTDQTGFQTPVSGLFVAAGTGGTLPPWNGHIAGDAAVAFRNGGGASPANLGLNAQFNDRFPFYPVVFSGQNPSALSAGDAITINDGVNSAYNVTLFTSAGTLAEAAAAINAASAAQSTPNVVEAQVEGFGASSPVNRLAIFSTVPRDAGTIALSNNSGTPLATLAIGAGTYSTSGQLQPYAQVVSFPRSCTSTSLVAQNSQMTITDWFTGSAVVRTVTFNTDGAHGDLVSIATAINAAGAVGVSALVSSWGQCHLIIQAFISQQSHGLIIFDSTSNPLGALGVTSGDWFPNVPPHAWAVAQSEAVGDTGAAANVFNVGDIINLGYSLPTSNTTEVTPITVTVGPASGARTVDSAALAINVAAATAGWVRSTTLTATTGAGNRIFTLNSVGGLTIGMTVLDPANFGGSGLFLAGAYIEDINPATKTIITTSGPQSQMSSGASIDFGIIRADVVNPTSTGAALRIRNMTGGSVWVSDNTSVPLERVGMISGQHWPGQMPAGFQIGTQCDYNSITAGGACFLAEGMAPQYFADPVQYAGYVLRARYQFQHGMRLDEATFNDGNFATVPYGDALAWGGPAQTQYPLAATSAGVLKFNGNPLALANGGVALTVLTVATLPSCTSGLKGVMMAVSDATSPTYNGSLTGSGAVSVPVFCNGAAWTSH